MESSPRLPRACLRSTEKREKNSLLSRLLLLGQDYLFLIGGTVYEKTTLAHRQEEKTFSLKKTKAMSNRGLY